MAIDFKHLKRDDNLCSREDELLNKIENGKITPDVLEMLIRDPEWKRAYDNLMEYRCISEYSSELHTNIETMYSWAKNNFLDWALWTDSQMDYMGMGLPEEEKNTNKLKLSEEDINILKKYNLLYQRYCEK